MVINNKMSSYTFLYLKLLRKIQLKITDRMLSSNVKSHILLNTEQLVCSVKSELTLTWKRSDWNTSLVFL